jgi:hypothetical protein
MNYVEKYNAQPGLQFQPGQSRWPGAQGLVRGQGRRRQYRRVEEKILRHAPRRPAAGRPGLYPPQPARRCRWLVRGRTPTACSTCATRTSSPWAMCAPPPTPRRRRRCASKSWWSPRTCWPCAEQAPLPLKYDGYGSCPLTVEKGKVVLAEFGYGGKLLPTFPLDPTRGAPLGVVPQGHAAAVVLLERHAQGPRVADPPEQGGLRDPMLLASLFGVFMGLVMGLTGAGGGILGVPALVLGLGLTMTQAAPGVIARRGCGGSGGGHRWFAPWPGALPRGVADRLARRPVFAAGRVRRPPTARTPVLMGLFSALMVLVAWRMLQREKREAGPSDHGAASWGQKNCMLDQQTGRLAWTAKCSATLAAFGCGDRRRVGFAGRGRRLPDRASVQATDRRADARDRRHLA